MDENKDDEGWNEQRETEYMNEMQSYMDGMRRFHPASSLTGEECFVATVVNGDLHAPQVETLREIRDVVLQETSLGRILNPTKDSLLP
jgi:hypothetical protein